MIRADLLLRGVRELATLSSGPRPRLGGTMEELSVIEDAAVAIDAGRFAWVGRDRAASREVRPRSTGRVVRAEGAVGLPGLVDAHSHLLFAGDRAPEMTLKARGASYLEIARHGGGLLSTVRATRSASDRALLDQSADRVGALARSGATSFEVKSGYALSHSGELRLLGLVRRLARRTGFRLVPTFLGAHAVPPEFRGRPTAYIDQIVRKTLPEVAARHLARFCDVFCEPGFFSVRDSERLLRAARRLGLGTKIHADEFVYSRGARLAARLRTRSADHLLATPSGDFERLASAGVTAVLLPLTAFSSGASRRSPAREAVDAGVPVALGSDCSPATWVDSMPAVLAAAVHAGRLTPGEAITAATVNAAHASGLDDAGTVEVGRPADLALFDLPSVRHLGYRFDARPTLVLRQGKPVFPP